MFTKLELKTAMGELCSPKELFTFESRFRISYLPNALKITAMVFILAACTTTKEDAVKSDIEAQHATDAAFNRADEKTFKAQNDADEKSNRVLTEANVKLDHIQDEAQAKSEDAYVDAERTAKGAQEKVSEVRRSEFVDRIAAKIKDLRIDIAAYDQNARKGKKSDSKKAKEHVVSMESHVERADNALRGTRTASLKDWEKTVPGVENATQLASDKVSSMTAGR